LVAAPQGCCRSEKDDEAEEGSPKRPRGNPRFWRDEERPNDSDESRQGNRQNYPNDAPGCRRGAPVANRGEGGQFEEEAKREIPQAKSIHVESYVVALTLIKWGVSLSNMLLIATISLLNSEF
jgi:hypothetical protein